MNNFILSSAFTVASALAASGCSTALNSKSNNKPIRYERVGPVIAEIYKIKDGTCERRVYLDSMYFVTVVPCH